MDGDASVFVYVMFDVALVGMSVLVSLLCVCACMHVSVALREVHGCVFVHVCAWLYVRAYACVPVALDT